jgi:membrane protein YqaA with SNARE-associated domain
MKKLDQYSKQVLIGVGVLAVFGIALYFAQALSESTAVVTLVERWGYVGVLLVAIVAGLNTVIPLPAATFTPLFISAGLVMPLVILTLAVGTLIADGLGFALGHVSRELIEAKYPKIFSLFTEIATRRTAWLIPIVFLYASFVPFPNEAILIPLALAGVKFKTLIAPLIIGNIVHQLILVYGISTLTTILF